jgi:2-oxoglutarate/2-oxoacid ferredoxin oxidoreductase subunit beta
MNYRSKIMPTWCPGCANFLIYSGLQKALDELKIESKDVVIVYDIGCIGNMADFVKTYGIHGLHGRSIPVAMGVKMANEKLKVIVIGGDGGIYGEGLNHLIAAARMNIDITVLVANNFLYSLTTGQTSPTTPQGAKTKSTPQGNINVPINAEKLIGAINKEVWIKTVEKVDMETATKVIVEAIKNKGFSLLEFQQECVTFGKQLR